MADLLDNVVAARGGLNCWNELESVTAHLAQSCVLWAFKDRQGVPEGQALTEPPLVSIDLTEITFADQP